MGSDHSGTGLRPEPATDTSGSSTAPDQAGSAHPLLRGLIHAVKMLLDELLTRLESTQNGAGSRPTT